MGILQNLCIIRWETAKKAYDRSRSLSGKKHYSLKSGTDCFIQQGAFFGRRAREYPPDGVVAGNPADADTQPIKILCAELPDNRSQAVMSGCAAAKFETHDAGLEIQFIMRDKELPRIHTAPVQERLQGFPGKVHIGHGLGDEMPGIAAGHTAAPEFAFELGAGKLFHLPRAAAFLQQGVKHGKTEVMARIPVFFSRVSQPGYATCVVHASLPAVQAQV